MGTTAAKPTDISPTSQIQQLEDAAREAQDARKEYERAGQVYAGLACIESKLEAERPGLKLAAIKRLMEQENPVAKPDGFGKRHQHSASSAEAVVETDPEYAAHLKLQRETVRDKNHAHCRMESARMRAYTALAVLRSIGGFQ